VNSLGQNCYLTPLLVMPLLTGVKMAGFAHVAGLGLFVQKNAIAATTPISTAFKLCIRNRKMGS
jgi:hypothetical protein